MLRFGYDKFDDDTWEIIKPNGLIGQEEVPETYRLYLPPWYGEIFMANEIPFKIKSSEQLIKENHNDKWIYLLVRVLQLQNLRMVQNIFYLHFSLFF